MIFAILGLATWRVSSLITSETGPFRVFERLRRRVGVDEPGEVTGLQDLLSCVWCLSIWVGAGWLAFLRLAPTAATWASYVAALSAVAVGMERLVRPR